LIVDADDLPELSVPKFANLRIAVGKDARAEVETEWRHTFEREIFSRDHCSSPVRLASFDELVKTVFDFVRRDHAQR